MEIFIEILILILACVNFVYGAYSLAGIIMGKYTSFCCLQKAATVTACCILIIAALSMIGIIITNFPFVKH